VTYSMFPAIELKVKNFEQFDREISQFKADIKTKVRRAGLVEMAKPVRDTIKASINDRSGALKKSIGYASVRKGDKPVLGFGVDDEALVVGSIRKVFGYTGGKSWQISKLRWLDQGTQQHEIKPKKGHYLNIQGHRVSGSVIHPGVKARHILQRAYSQHQGEFETLFSKGGARALRRYGATVL